MMMPQGVGFADVQAAEERENGPANGNTHLLWSENGQVSTVPPAMAEAIFFHDCPSAIARTAAARLTPQGIGTRGGKPVKTERLISLPRLYIEASKDRSVPISVQRRMQSLLPGALVAELRTGHVPQLSAPDLLAAALLPFLTGKRDDELP